MWNRFDVSRYDRWAAVFTVNNYGIAYVNERNDEGTDDVPRRGEYPFLLLDVDGHPEMKDFVHLPPSDVCAKLMPKIHEKVVDNTDEIVEFDSEKDEKRRFARDRLDCLVEWTPRSCMAWNSKEKRNKPSMPNPANNDWAVVPNESVLHKWALSAPMSAPPKKVAGKRKEPELDGLRVVKSPELEEAGFAWLMTVPIDENCTVERVDGTLRVVQMKPMAKADEEAVGGEGAVEE
jgi:hypothetical protein